MPVVLRLCQLSSVVATRQGMGFQPPIFEVIPMCAIHVLGDIVQALQSGDVPGLSTALEAAVTYLACHAQRAHPKRDRHIGRLQLGLEPFFGSDDAIEFATAA